MSLTIVTSHWKENLEWLKKSKFPVILIDKEGSDPSCFEPQHIIPNKNNETSSFIKYIIENYENLPDHIAFIHGHENAYHQKHDRPLLEVIEGSNLEHGYIHLNGWVRFCNFYNEEGVLNAPKLWDDLKLPNKPALGSILVFQPNSQFIVSKERIRLHSKELYEHIYKVLMNSQKEYCPFTKTYHYKIAIFLNPRGTFYSVKVGNISMIQRGLSSNTYQSAGMTIRSSRTF